MSLSPGRVLPKRRFCFSCATLDLRKTGAACKGLSPAMCRECTPVCARSDPISVAEELDLCKPEAWTRKSKIKYRPGAAAEDWTGTREGQKLDIFCGSYLRSGFTNL
ncbi:hypothetical protein KIW84_071796 [Lathyrus oleraceus]|uniref:Uncharacterized protein n=1 Tax=Pisum sativum TaxID=3888 RepID=A0A9D4VJQ8_PEA|nr:hypothetical protein KIW84_MT0039 [Pisum sativum]KAI5384942.1 hypothetical protein KIW84_071796 [Pisum sativum]